TWALHSDADHLLRPIASTLEAKQSFEKQNGFAMMASQFGTFAFTLGVLALGLWASTRKQRWSPIAACIAGVGTLVLSWEMVGAAAGIPTVANGAKDLQYVSTYLSAGADFSITVANTTADAVTVDTRGLVVAAVSAVWLAACWAFLRQKRLLVSIAIAVGTVGLGEGLLVQPNGATYLAIALLITAGLLMVSAGLRAVSQFMPQLQSQVARWGRRFASNGGAGLLLLLAFFVALKPTSSARADQATVTTSRIPNALRSAERSDQTWTIRGHRVFGSADLTVRAMAGDSFILLRPPAILTGFSGEDLRINKQEVDGQTLYKIDATRAGLLHAHVLFEMPIASYSDHIPIPTAVAASQRLTVQVNEGGWEFTADGAVQIETLPDSNEGQSGASLILSPSSESFISLRPRQRDPAKESVEFFDEAQQLLVAGSGSVNGIAVFSVRPVQGQVSELVFDVPAGMIVGDVKGSTIGLWRFDPASRRLHVAIEPAQTKSFNLRVESQLATGAVPYEISIAPIRLQKARGESGTLALAAEGDITTDGIRATKLNALSSTDFNLGRFLGRSDTAAVQSVWHYTADAGELKVHVTAMQPEVRAELKQLFSLDDDRVVASVDLSAEITRVGLFQLSFVIPENLDVEAISGNALAQWNQKTEGGERIAILQLRERTLGAANFAITLSGSAPHNAAEWKLPSIALREANRQTGTLIVVPMKGLRLRTLTREHATPIDPQTLGAIQPGTLAFKQLDANSNVTLGLEALTPWITTQTLEDVIVRDGQTATRVITRVHIENAGVKQLNIRIPGLSAAAQRTVRASGSAVSELVHAGEGSENWELRFVRSVIGDADLQIDFQAASVPSGSSDRREVSPVVFTDTRQADTIVSIRPAGRLSIDVEKLGEGWKPADWSEVPDFLRSNQSEGAPTKCFHVENGASGLTLQMSRQGIAEALKMEINSAELTTLLSDRHGQLTEAVLQVRVSEKTRAQFSLPAHHQLFAVLVNGETVELTKENERYFFYVAPLNESERSASISVVYANDGDARKPSLQAPQFDLPMENVSWHVLTPFGFDLEKSVTNSGWARSATHALSDGPADLPTPVPSMNVGSARGAALLDAANASLASGDQGKAVEFLEKAAATMDLDEASNEDARVQLKKLKTQQAELSLTTRRERLSLNRKSIVSDPSEMASSAASINPLLRDATNFDPQQFDQLIAANSAEENEQLSDIAAHLVDHQQDRVPSPRQVMPTLKTDGSVTTFTRTLQVNTSKPLELAVVLEPITVGRPLAGIWILAALGMAGLLVGGTRARRTE
ncbi:MAG TPA: hypothetical protein VIM69_09745, partial [Opitutaceae bacterium]